MRQLAYVSIADHAFSEDELSAILTQSRYNNALEEVTGILWSDGDRFIQVLEGPSASVRETYERIRNDDRHHHLVIIHDQLVNERQFGEWSMCHKRSYETEDEYDGRIERLLAKIGKSLGADLTDFITDRHGGDVSADRATS